MSRKLQTPFESLQFSDTFYLWLSTLLFLPLTFFFRFINGTWLILDKDYPSYLLSFWVVGIVFTLWISLKWLFDDKFLITGLEAFLGLFFFVMVLSAIFSVNPGLSFEKLIGVAAYFFGIYLLIDLKRFPILWKGISNALAATAGFNSLLILATALIWILRFEITPSQIFSEPSYILDILPRLPNFLNLGPSVTAGYLVLILPLSIYLFLKSEKIFWKALLAINTVINLTALFLTQSRGGLLGLMCMLAAFIILYRKRLFEIIFKSRAVGIIGTGLFLLLLSGSIYLVGNARDFSLLGSTLSIRYQAWQTAFEIIRHHPWFGSGLGTFGMLYIKYRDPSIDAGTIIHAHNELLQVTSELGILGLVSLVLISWRGFRIIQKSKKNLPDSFQMVVIAFAGLAGILLPDAIFTSSNIVMISIFYFIWILPQRNSLPLKKRNLIYTIITLIIVTLGIGTYWNLWKISPYHLALESIEQEDWLKATTHLAAAQDRDSGNPYYQHAAGYTTGQQACRSGTGYQEAINHYQESFSAYMEWGIDHANTAALYAASSDYQSAVQQMILALEFQPEEPFYHCLLGDYYNSLGKREQALPSYATCIGKEPGLLDSPYWQENIERRDLMDETILQAEEFLKSWENDQKLVNLAHLYLLTNRLQLSDQTIHKYLQTNPKDLTGNLVYLDLLEKYGEELAAGLLLEDLLFNYPRYQKIWARSGKKAFNDGMLERSEADFILSFQLNPHRYQSWYLGLIYQSQDKLEEALVFYEQALRRNESELKFSRHVAARWPIKGVYLECIPDMLTYREFYDPALEAARSLAEIDCNQAACIYQSLLQRIPSSLEFRILLENLPCYNDFDPIQCFNSDLEPSK